MLLFSCFCVCGECRGGEAVVHGVGGEAEEACGEHGGGAGDHGGYDGLCCEASGEPESKTQRQQQGGGAEAEGEEAEVVDEGAAHEVRRQHAQRQQGHDGQPEAAQGVAVDHIAHDDGGGAEHQAAAAAQDVDQQGAEGYAAEPRGQVADDERGEGLKGILEDADAVGEALACGLQGGGFGGGDVVAAHVHAHEGAGGANERYEGGAVDGAEFRLARRGCRPDALCVGLRADDAECEREAAAEVFQRAAGEEGAVAAVDVLGTGDVVQRRQLRRCVYLRNAVAYAAEAVAYVPHGDACRQRADVEQHQFDYAASPCAAYAAAEHHGGYEEGAYGQGPPHGQTEEAAEHGRRGEELRGDADEYAHKEEDGAHRFGAAAILLAHHLHEGGASAAA